VRRVFNAVVVGLCDTDTSEYLGGAVAVSFDVSAPAPIGETGRRITLPLFTQEQARELGPMYRNGTVQLIIETEPPRDSVKWIVTDGNDPDICDDGEFGVEVNGTPYLYYKYTEPGPSPDAKYRPIAGREFGETIRRSAAPPIVNGRPSCCEMASNIGPSASRSPGGFPGWVLKIEGMYIKNCPYCGARLPELPEKP
jgi:hypothetical protein